MYMPRPLGNTSCQLYVFLRDSRPLGVTRESLCVVEELCDVSLAGFLQRPESRRGKTEILLQILRYFSN